jgi:hypothetical protein
MKVIFARLLMTSRQGPNHWTDFFKFDMGEFHLKLFGISDFSHEER